MAESIVTTCIVLLALGFWSAWSWPKIPAQYAARGCQGAAWRTAFPSASKLSIREFLGVFVGAFLFPGEARLKFSPNDNILSVYKAVYGRQNVVDAMELETLAIDVEAKYGVQLSQVWSEGLTLGQLFACIQVENVK